MMTSTEDDRKRMPELKGAGSHRPCAIYKKAILESRDVWKSSSPRSRDLAPCISTRGHKQIGSAATEKLKEGYGAWKYMETVPKDEYRPCRASNHPRKNKSCESKT